jgi:hypothetical protein
MVLKYGNAQTKKKSVMEQWDDQETKKKLTLFIPKIPLLCSHKSGHVVIGLLGSRGSSEESHIGIDLARMKKHTLTVTKGECEYWLIFQQASSTWQYTMTC